MVKRFINADGYASTGQGFVGYNMFAYCNNRPVNASDGVGSRPIESLSIASETPWQRAWSISSISKRYNITRLLQNWLRKNYATMKSYRKHNNAVFTCAYFFNKVRPHGEWDAKSSSKLMLSKDVTYIYRGQELRFDDIGNINYGYVGKVLFSKPTLLKGAGAIQVACGTSHLSYWNSNFDDPHDQWAISFGYDLKITPGEIHTNGTF